MTSNTIIELRTPSANDEYRLLCSGCGVEAFHKPLTVVATTDNIDATGISYWSEYMVVQCQGCKCISFYSEHRNSEDLFFNPETEEEEPEVRVEIYPPRKECTEGLNDLCSLPIRVQEIYKETQTAIANKQQILAGIGIRAILEAVCRHKGLDKGDLEGRIDKLQDLGVVTSEGAEILHGLRFLGNDSAHEIKAHSVNELQVAIGIVNHLLTGTYLLPDRAKIFRRRPPKTAGTKSTITQNP